MISGSMISELMLRIDDLPIKSSFIDHSFIDHSFIDDGHSFIDDGHSFIDDFIRSSMNLLCVGG
jgi:hypothetical protein